MNGAPLTPPTTPSSINGQQQLVTLNGYNGKINGQHENVVHTNGLSKTTPVTESTYTHTIIYIIEKIGITYMLYMHLDA